MIITEYGCDQDVLKGVKTPKDFESLCRLEQAHAPVIAAPARVRRNEVFDVTIGVGMQEAHPNRPDHFIEWIELYSDNNFLFRVNLSGSLGQPKITIPVRLMHRGQLKIWHKCNMHGIWEGAKEIEVIE